VTHFLDIPNVRSQFVDSNRTLNFNYVKLRDLVELIIIVLLLDSYYVSSSALNRCSSRRPLVARKTWCGTIGAVKASWPRVASNNSEALMIIGAFSSILRRKVTFEIIVISMTMHGPRPLCSPTIDDVSSSSFGRACC